MKTVSVTTLPTTIAKARLTINTTARVRFTRPQQQKVQRGASDCPDPLPGPDRAAAVRLGLSVMPTSTPVPHGTLKLARRAVMAETQDTLNFQRGAGARTLGQPSARAHALGRKMLL